MEHFYIFSFRRKVSSDWEVEITIRWSGASTPKIKILKKVSKKRHLHSSTTTDYSTSEVKTHFRSHFHASTRLLCKNELILIKTTASLSKNQRAKGKSKPSSQIVNISIALAFLRNIQLLKQISPKTLNKQSKVNKTKHKTKPQKRQSWCKQKYRDY